MSCPCGSNEGYEVCCGALHAGTRKAANPEELMRSRYTAFVKGDAAYLAKSATVDDSDWEATSQWSKSIPWLGLKIVSTGPGTVEFEAKYLENAEVVTLHEKSRFIEKDGGWLYDDGESEVAREKVERNAPCPCGSGKKFKQCHA